MALPELVTRSVLDVVTENYERAGLKALACRLIYAGMHNQEKKDLIKLFRKSVKSVNAGYCDVPCHGFLVAYDGYFTHIIEGSEDIIMRQIRFLIADAEKAEAKKETKETDNQIENEIDEEEDNKSRLGPFKRMKVIMVYHSIEKRLFDSWNYLVAKPPTLLMKSDAHAGLEAHVEQLRLCISKLDRLVEMFQQDNHLTFEGLSAADEKMSALPECALLELLLQSPHLLDVKEYLAIHRFVPDYIFAYEQVWPTPSAFTPRYLYKLKIDDTFVDPLPLQDWQIQEAEEKRKKKEEEENEEGASEEDSD